MITLYGIRNCDTVKKARKWLDNEAIGYQFVDFKQSPPDEALLKAWCQHLGWQDLINRRGTTWRKLSDDDKSDLNLAKAIKLMIAQPNLIKRPVWQLKQGMLLGFTDDVRQEFWAAKSI